MSWLMRAFPYDPVLATQITIYASVDGFVTEPDEGDAAVNTYWDRRIEVPMQVERSLFDGDNIGGDGSASFGAIRVANDEGGIDHWLDLCWDGRRVELYRASVANPRYLADFTLIATGTIEEIVPGDMVDLVLTDAQARFQAPATRGVFAGTGGVEGSAELKGRGKPWLIGRRRLFEPVLIDATLNKYMIDPAGIHALLDAEDGGDPFTLAGADQANDAALSALSMAGIEYATCLAEGTMRLAEKPVLKLRVSAEGVAPGGTWISTCADLVRYVAITFAGLDAGDIDDDSIVAMATAQPAVLGYWHDGSSAVTVQAVVDALLDSVGGWCGVAENGLFEVGIYALAEVTAVASFVERDMLDLTPRQAGQRIKSVRLGYRPTLALSESEIVDGLPAAPREAAMNDVRWTDPATHSATAAESLLADTLEKRTLIDEAADAEAERDRLLDLYRRQRRPFDLTVPLVLAGAVRIGRTVHIQAARHGLAAGRHVVVLRTSVDTEADTATMTMTVL